MGGAFPVSGSWGEAAISGMTESGNPSPPLSARLQIHSVCSGDAGVYGMASPILELAPNYPSVEIEVIPGLTAALSGGAVLGAPLAHDFCVISLSDRLTPWEIIEKRLAESKERSLKLS